MKTEREGSHLKAKETDAEDTGPADLDLRLLAHRTVRNLSSVV